MGKRLSRNALVGYPAGIVTGVTYGLNPLFAVPLMRDGASISAILFFRYALAVCILGVWLYVGRTRISVSWKQAGVLFALGVLYTCSSAFLFEAYGYIASGVATTLVFLYPVLVAVVMAFLGVVPSWKVWCAIVATFIGVVVMTQGGEVHRMNPIGIVLSVASALSYSFFIIIINRSRMIADISNTLLTFYALIVGAIFFLFRVLWTGHSVTDGIDGTWAWFCLLGLALLPTIVSTASLAIATRNIGATKASVLGVFEPVTAILVGTLVFGEPLTVNVLLGIGISMAAVIFMIMFTKR